MRIGRPARAARATLVGCVLPTYDLGVETEQVLMGNLQPGEQILWSGRPDSRALLTPGDAFAIPFGLLFLGFSVFWERVAFTSQAPFFFRLWGVPFIVVGVYLVVGRFMHTWYVLKQTVYAITDRRAIVVSRRRWVDSPIQGQPVSVTSSRSGRASVAIGTPVPMFVGGPMSVGPGGAPIFSSRRRVRYLAPVTFFQVADAEAMLAALNQARTATSGA
jgi:hypothetical protein